MTLGPHTEKFFKLFCYTSPEAALSIITWTRLYNFVHKGNTNSTQLKSLSQKSTCKKHLLLTSEALLNAAV